MNQFALFTEDKKRASKRVKGGANGIINRLDRFISVYQANTGHPPETITLSSGEYSLLEKQKNSYGSLRFEDGYKGVKLLKEST